MNQIIKKQMQTEFSRHEKFERLLHTLSQLIRDKSIEQSEYDTLRHFYENELTDSAKSLSKLKKQVQTEIALLDSDISICRNQWTKHKKEARSTQKTENELSKLLKERSALEKLLTSKSSVDVGGYKDISMIVS